MVIALFTEVLYGQVIFTEQAANLGCGGSTYGFGSLGGGISFYDFDNDGWDQTYWDGTAGRWASTPDFNAPVPAWLANDGKKRRHWPRLGNRRAPDNTIIARCRAHDSCYGRDETTSSPEPTKWRDVIVRKGSDVDTVNYSQWTAPVTAGASQWTIQE